MFELFGWVLAILAAFLFAVWLFARAKRVQDKRVDRGRKDIAIKEWDDHCKEFERKRRED